MYCQTNIKTMNKEEIIDLWIEAEEQNQIGTEESVEKCLELKDQFSNEWAKLSLEDKQYVVDYLDGM